ncbi:uncharacterized protein LODBEIA_P30200 [Lodderomyces beijingensis]|uniref:EF-hand domain-containing protein n=1 Tax=Lodderomyces beijingensis TaxID=1775926 RepID=A0ABP0ZNV2_9ASCO
MDSGDKYWHWSDSKAALSNNHHQNHRHRFGNNNDDDPDLDILDSRSGGEVSASYDEEYDPNKSYSGNWRRHSSMFEASQAQSRQGYQRLGDDVEGSTRLHRSSLHSDRKSVLSESSNIHTVQSMRDRRPTLSKNDSAVLVEKSLRDDYLEDLKEGLKYALGTDSKGANWFPVSSHNVSRDDLAGDKQSTETAEYTTTIPLQDMSSIRPGNSRSISQNSVNRRSPFHNDNSLDFPAQASTEALSISATWLEAPGLKLPSPHPSNPPPVASPTPTRFADALTRISNRIAGAGDHLKNENNQDLASAISVHSGPSQTSLMLKTPVGEHGSFFDDVEFSPAKKSAASPRRSPIPTTTKPKPIPDVTLTTAEADSIYTSESTSKGLGIWRMKSKEAEQDHNLPGSETISNHTLRTKDTEPTDPNEPNEPNESATTSKSFAAAKMPRPRMRQLYGKSLKLFSPNSRVRKICHLVLKNNLTNTFMLAILILQVILLSYRQWDPHALAGYFYSGNNWADILLILINVIYTIEIFAQIIAYGLLDDSVMFKELNLSYPKNEFGRLDFGADYLKKLFRLLKTNRNKRNIKRRHDWNTKVVESEDSNGSSDEQFDMTDATRESDVDLSSQQLLGSKTDLKSKYNLDSFHNTTFSSSPVRKRDFSSNFHLRSTNTFFMSDSANGSVDETQLKRAFLRSSWHRLDFLSMVFFWVSLLLSINRYDAKHHIMLFRSLGCLRILRLCNLTAGTTTILAACKAAIPQLIDVSIFIACFWLFFGIIGVQSFKSSLTRHCEWTNPDDASETFINEDSYCGSFIGLNGNKMSYITREGHSSGVIKGFRCPKYSRCVTGDNPYNGTVSFDNILQSLQMVFVVMSANTFTDIMYMTMDSDNMAACLFFIACIFVMTVWLLNVFIAVIVASFNMRRLEAAEDKARRSNEKFMSKFLGFPANDQIFQEKLEELKRANKWLRYYYKAEFVFIIAVAANLFAQCFRSSRMSTSRGQILDRFEIAFAAVFAIEIVVRFILYLPRWRLFFYPKRNSFDLLLGVMCIVIVIPPIKEKLGHAYYWLTMFQLMRFYRVVLATPFTSKLWLKMMGNFRALFDLALFYFILLYLVSIILARYFEGAIPFEEIDDVDFPMDTLPAAFIALYVITSTENWTDVMYSLQQYATTTSSRCFGSIFLVAWFMLSNMIILNIFIAVIAKTLEVSEEIKRKHQLIQFIDIMTNRLQHIDSESGLLMKIKTKLFRRKRDEKDELEKAVVNLLLSGTAVQEFLDKDLQNEIDNDDDLDSLNVIKMMPSQKWKRWFQVNFARAFNFLTNPFHVEVSRRHNNFVVENFEPANFATTIMKERKVLINKRNEFLEANPRYNYVFYIMSPRHKLRRLCQRMVKPSYGERIQGVEPFRPISETIVVIMFLATIGLVILACYMTPIYRMNVKSNWIFWSEYSFALVFTVEFLIKVLADGLIFTPNAYCRSSWNLIDFVVLVSLWIEAIAYLKNDGNLSRIVRGLKALRALRLLTISETAKSNFHNTMIAGFGKILNAALISLCLLFPFSIWGLNIFNGRLGYCLDGNSERAECFNEYTNEVFNWEIVSPNIYTNPQLEFNRFGSAFATLFEIVSLEGWTDLLKNLMNSTGVGTVPETNATPLNGVFIVFFNFLSIVFILTLFVSVIISNYSRTTGRAYMTADQISWYQVKKILVQVKPSKRKDFESLSPFRRFCYRMTVERNKIWTRTLNCFLFLHTLALLLECFPSSDGLNTFRMIVYTVATALFFANAVMLAIAQGFKTFIHYKWNIFNLVASFGAFVTTTIAYNIEQSSPFMNFNKLFLVVLLLFVIPRSNRLSQLLRFASASLPSILSLSFTWIIVFLVFAIAMNQIFGLTKIGPNGTGNLNLRSVPKTLIVLFRCSFGEGWNYIMEDYTLAAPFCTNGENLDHNDCGSKQYAYILFISWNIISMYIFLNMFISLILDSFDYVNQKSKYSDLIQREEIRKFKRTWQKFDPRGTGYIKPIDLPKLLHSLQGALSFRFYTGQLEIKELCKRWIRRNNPHDPYDVTVDFDQIEQTVSQMDIDKVRARRRAYEMFIEEALLTMELNDDSGISFTRILLQLPLYTTFDTGTCFNLIDYLERRLLVSKVMKRLYTKRVYETIAAYACRWKYQKNRRHGIRDADIAFDKQLNRRSYLANANLWVNTDRAPTIFVSDEPEKSKDEKVNQKKPSSDPKFKSSHFEVSQQERSDDMQDEDFEDSAFEQTQRNSFIYGDQSMSSGVYYPSSPIQKTTKYTTSPSRYPNLHIEIPHSGKVFGHSIQEVVDDDISVSPFLDPSETKGEHKSDDVRSVDELIGSSPWRDALNEAKHHKPK